MDRIVVSDDPASLQAIAERIDTGVGDPAVVRALVVFNLGDTPATGLAVYQVSMRWPIDQPLPPVIVRSSTSTVPSLIRAYTERPEPGRDDRKRVRFDLVFEVTDVPPHGWKVYWSEYAAAPTAAVPSGTEHLDLRVVETRCHSGDLPSL